MGTVSLVATLLATIGYLLPPVPPFALLYLVGAVVIGVLWPRRAYLLSVAFLYMSLLATVSLDGLFGRRGDDPGQMLLVGAISSLVFGLLGFVGVAIHWIWRRYYRTR